MSMGQIVHPAFRHVALGAATVIFTQHHHRHSLDVQCRKAEGASTYEVNQIPVNKQEIESGWIANEYRWAGESIEPSYVILHRLRRRAGFAAADFPSFGVLSPPRQRIRDDQKRWEEFPGLPKTWQ